MKVILTEKVPFLGNVGEIVSVSAGHARNYLIPRKLAVTADESNKRQLEDGQKRLSKKINEYKKAAEDMKKRIDGQHIELFKKVGGSGKLFGSVTNTELAKELESKGIMVERRLINIDNPIKSLGNFDITVKLFKDVDATFQVKVSIDPAQVEEMKKQQLLAEKRKADKKLAEAKALEEGTTEENQEGSEDDNEEVEEEEEN